MPQQNPGFVRMLQSIISKLEMGALILTAIGLALLYIGRSESQTVLMLGLSVLAGVFFLTAFMVVPTLPDGSTASPGQKKGFMELIGTIVWKAIHIGCSVTTIGILFYLLHMPGYGQQLLIGVTALVASLLLAIISIAQKNENYAILQGAITRAVPLLIIGGYILYTNWPLQS